MAYTKTIWVDRAVQYPHRYTQETSGDNVTLTPAPGTVTQTGTAFSAENMNHIETGIKDAHDALEDINHTATTSSSGLMSAADKTELQRLGAIDNADETHDGYLTKEDFAWLQQLKAIITIENDGISLNNKYLDGALFR